MIWPIWLQVNFEILADILLHSFDSTNIGQIKATRIRYGIIDNSGIDIVPILSILVTTRPNS